MTRRADWVARLQAYLETNAHRAFEYGTWDCCMFAGGAIEAVTGVDLAAGARGQYGSRDEGLALLEQDGGIEEVLSELQEVPLLRAQRGDLVMMSDPEAFTVGIVAFNGREALVIGEDGLEQVPVTTFQRAWRV
jgi:hypothetical protein